jgi:MerR family copper efflux transcriptional regulator
VVKLSDYLRISEAAEYLGVSPNTLRNWVNAGKIAAIRHPVNDYRLFKREDLDALLKQVAAASKKATKRWCGLVAIGRAEMRVAKAGSAHVDDIAGSEHGGPKKNEQGEAASVFGSVLVQNHQSWSIDRGYEDAAFPLGCRCLGGGEHQPGAAR